MMRILSLGAGVQSTTLALMASRGEIEPVDAAIFADTKSEPRSVYEHLAKLMTPGILPFPVHIVSKGSLRQEILDAVAGRAKAWGRPPFFIINSDGSRGMTRRQCTQDYKLVPIYREVRKLAGVKPRSRGPKGPIVEQLIGISIDEAHRQRDAQFRWIKNKYPLVEMGLSRTDCVLKLRSWGWTAPKSACTFCPYQSNAQWLDLQRQDPEAFADAVAIDDAIRSGIPLIKGTPYLHSSRKPLRDVRLIAKPRQINLFGNECAGVCGV